MNVLRRFARPRSHENRDERSVWGGQENCI
jgi:hypothetical protein